jgi:hypothetical protein
MKPAAAILRVEEYYSILKIEAASFSEKLVPIYLTIQCHTPEDHNPDIIRCL